MSYTTLRTKAKSKSEFEPKINRDKGGKSELVVKETSGRLPADFLPRPGQFHIEPFTRSVSDFLIRQISDAAEVHTTLLNLEPAFSHGSPVKGHIHCYVCARAQRPGLFNRVLYESNQMKRHARQQYTKNRFRRKREGGLTVMQMTDHSRPIIGL